MHKLGMRGERGTVTLTVHRLGLNSPGDGGSRPNGQGKEGKRGSALRAARMERSAALSRALSPPSLARSLSRRSLCS